MEIKDIWKRILRFSEIAPRRFLILGPFHDKDDFFGFEPFSKSFPFQKPVCIITNAFYRKNETIFRFCLNFQGLVSVLQIEFLGKSFTAAKTDTMTSSLSRLFLKRSEKSTSDPFSSERESYSYALQSNWLAFFIVKRAIGDANKVRVQESAKVKVRRSWELFL